MGFVLRRHIPCKFRAKNQYENYKNITIIFRKKYRENYRLSPTLTGREMEGKGKESESKGEGERHAPTGILNELPSRTHLSISFRFFFC